MKNQTYHPSSLKTLSALRTHGLFIGLALLAIILRVVFWLYTGRVWEDSLITLNNASNFWLGNGLTHHLNEAKAQSFTSPIGLFIPLIGEAVNQGLWLLRISSLTASVGSIFIAYLIGQKWNFSWQGQFLVMGYLACDQLQIFFGMAGMETQVATFLMLCLVYFLITERWLALGVIAGLGMLTRPEFIFCILILMSYLIIWRRQQLLLVLGPILVIVAPWALFSQTYFGSLIPNTVQAKSFAGNYGPFTMPPSFLWDYFFSSWKHIAPFWQWVFVTKIPIPNFLTVASVTLLVALFTAGVIWALVKRSIPTLVVACIVLLFAIYRNAAILSSYFMWYLPPFLALLFLIAGLGLSILSRRAKFLASLISVFLTGMYALHIPYSFAIEKVVQKDIDCAVRFKTGSILNQLMGPTDTVILEPVGYLGYAAFNKTIYDYPGLTSPTAVKTIGKIKKFAMMDLAAELQPGFLVLRPSEFQAFESGPSIFKNNYVKVSEITTDREPNIQRAGYESRGNLGDTHFVIMKRINPPTELSENVSLEPNALYSTDRFHICH